MKRSLRGRFSSRSSDEYVNPMDGVANLADVMLILAVGIMLALVIHWNVDIGAMAYLPEDAIGVDADNAVVFESDWLEEIGDDVEQIDSGDMERFGTVFHDAATGRFYIITD